MTIPRYALIIGAAKSGTTALFDFLSQHPEIAPSDPKEPHFFGGDPGRWDGRIEDYERFFTFDPRQHKFALEGSTLYTMSPVYPSAATNIARVDREFRFIYIMRNPIDRIESEYTMNLANGWMDGTEKRELLMRRSLSTSKYAAQLDQFHHRFSADSFLLLNHDDLNSDPIEVVNTVCAFLDVSPPPANLDVGIRGMQNRGRIANHQLWDAARRWNLAQRFAALIPVAQREKLRRFFGRKIAGTIRFTDDQRARILDEIKEDIIRLRDHYRFDVSSWNLSL